MSTETKDETTQALEAIAHALRLLGTAGAAEPTGAFGMLSTQST